MKGGVFLKRSDAFRFATSGSGHTHMAVLASEPAETRETRAADTPTTPARSIQRDSHK